LRKTVAAAIMSRRWFCARLQRQESARDARMQVLDLTKLRSLVALPRPRRAPNIHYIRSFRRVTPPSQRSVTARFADLTHRSIQRLNLTVTRRTAMLALPLANVVTSGNRDALT
jgi:hypothetical protein